MIEIKLVKDCPFNDAHNVWNQGFSDYYTDVQISLTQFAFKLGFDELSPEYSFIAYAQGVPVGIIMNGIKVLGEKKWAWNGGTTVIPAYRGKGISKLLMEASMSLYKREGIDIASLEVFRVNKQAIHLYSSFDYQEVDRLLFLELNEVNSKNFFTADTTLYNIKHVAPLDVRNISFYDYSVPWKTNWNLIQNGQAAIAINQNEEVIGYALYQRKLDQESKIRTVILYQCVVNSKVKEQPFILKMLLNEIILENTSKDIRIVTYNLPSKNDQLIEILKEVGCKEVLTPEGIPLEQVFMIKEM